MFNNARARTRWLPATFAYLVWLGLYGLPLGLALAGPSLADGLSRVSGQAVQNPAVLLGGIANLTAMLLFVSLAFGVLYSLGSASAAPLRIREPIGVLCSLLAGWVVLMAVNARCFPRSTYELPLLTSATALVASALTLLLLTAACTWTLLRKLRRHLRPVAVGAGLGGFSVVCLGLFAASAQPGEAAIGTATAPRNIVLLGIDSLSWPLLQAEAHRLPHLSALAASAHRHERAYTPIGRTYPAWVSILSGQPPAQHGALFNLRRLDLAQRGDLLTQTLRGRGYRTIYAIDERRFNNIDESFGFDAIVGPCAGALDFVLQRLNDTPLTNLLLQTRLGAWALPYSHLNVAAHASYDAQGFVDAIGRNLGPGEQPVLLAVHLLSGHFPFSTRHGTHDVQHANPIRAKHVEALTAVDQQVGALVEMLRRQGRLDDALVVLLSDHGEAIGEPEAYRDAQGRLIPDSSYGHGANLLSEHQNRIVLAVARYQDGRVVGPGGRDDRQVSLLDVRAAAERFASTGQAMLAPAAECIPVETELRIAAAENYRDFDAGKVAAEGVSLYDLNAQGRLVLREALLPTLVARKEVGWRCADRLTTFRPQDGRYRAYRLADGEPPAEITPQADDVAAVDAYRARLLQAVSAGRP